MKSNLADVDELVLRCRGEEARAQFEEAVTCYKGGAFRSCIVATWLAVVFDVIAKLRELSASGDSIAGQEVAKLDAAVLANDYKCTLEFERDILKVARDKFELISSSEHVDLDRLHDDRNRCAHPSSNRLGEVYAPTAEVARLHMRVAVDLLLSQAPIQGKAALNRVMTTIDSTLFPTDEQSAMVVLREGPMGHPKPILLRNLVNALVSALITTDEKWKQRAMALRAVRRLHRADVEPLLAKRLKEKGDAVVEEDATRLLRLTMEVDDTWRHLSQAAIEQLLVFAKKVRPDTNPQGFSLALARSEIAHAVRPKISGLSLSVLSGLVDEEPRADYLDRAIELYGEAGSFNEANRVATSVVLPLVHLAEDTHAMKVIDQVRKNSQIRGSHRAAAVVEGLRTRSKATVTVIDARLLSDIYLHHLLPEDKQPKQVVGA